MCHVFVGEYGIQDNTLSCNQRLLTMAAGKRLPFSRGIGGPGYGDGGPFPMWLGRSLAIMFSVMTFCPLSAVMVGMSSTNGDLVQPTTNTAFLIFW